MTEQSDTVGSICARWWQRSIGADTGQTRKTRALLRRAGTPLEALSISAVHDLDRALYEAGLGVRKGPDWPDRLALIAIVLAHLTEPSGAPLARRFGAGDPKPLSPLRFDALIRARTARDLIRPLTRALFIVKGGANLPQLAEDLYWWTDATRTRWCFDYYSASDAMPETTTTEEEFL